MRYSLRSLLIALVVGPPIVAVAWHYGQRYWEARRAREQALQELKLIQAQISLLTAAPLDPVIPNSLIATTPGLSPTEKERLKATFQELRDQARVESERRMGLMYSPPDENEL